METGSEGTGPEVNEARKQRKCAEEEDTLMAWVFRHRNKVGVMLALAIGFTVGQVAGELKTRREYRGIY
jgi:hypothetical protein